MASVESGAAAATANAGGDASIWGGQNQGRKFTKRHMIAAGAVAGAAILGLGLYFGLKGDSGSSDRTIITGQADVASEGCYPDANYAARTMTDMIRRDDMTTEVRDIERERSERQRCIWRTAAVLFFSRNMHFVV